ncbi:MAG: class I SAM-dependent methyltransferase [Actinobacteria bacterium]|nr:class I SAM-dependent methyltransferase [Actinomycetota bacterium]
MKLRGVEKRVLSSRAWAAFSQRVVVPVALSVAPLPETARVLQIGCGGGFETAALARRFPRWEITAVDFDPEMVGLARRRLARFGPRMRIEEGDAVALPYDPGSFDVVLALLVWHHVGDWRRATAEAARVLRSDGRLVLADFLAPTFTGPVRALFPPEKAYRFGELREALGAAGLSRYRRAGGRWWYAVVAKKAVG